MEISYLYELYSRFVHIMCKKYLKTHKKVLIQLLLTIIILPNLYSKRKVKLSL